MADVHLTPTTPPEHHYAIIMAGGIGSRFWPMSRQAHPKQFLDLLGIGKSLLRLTFERLEKLLPAENILVVTNAEYGELVKEHLPEILAGNVLSEPTMRNTAPCIAYGTYKLLAKDPKALIVVAAADHLILDEEAFRQDLRTALAIVEQNEVIATLGIQPTRPDTGYGYIQYEDDEPETPQASYPVKTFTEKPSREMAETFLASGDFVWNSGIFIFAAPTMQVAMKQHLPEMDESFDGLAAAITTNSEQAFIEQAYATCRTISIDYGVMEKADNVRVLKGTFGWTDLGTWNSLWEQKADGPEANVLAGNIRTYDAKGNIVYSTSDKLIVLKSVENTILVEMDDVLLVCNRNDEQAVKSIVADLRDGNSLKYL